MQPVAEKKQVEAGVTAAKIFVKSQHRDRCREGSESLLNRFRRWSAMRTDRDRQ